MRTAVRTSPVPEATSAPRVAARRLARPSWRDPRFLVGLALVLASVVVGARVVSAAQRTTAVYAAAVAIAAGTRLTASDVRVVQVHLDPATEAAYVPADGSLESGLVALRGLGAGELLPRSAFGAPSDLTTRPVTVPADGGVPQGVRVGSQVDVWVVRPDDTRTTSTADAVAPRRLVGAAEVSAVVSGGQGLAARTGGQVQVLVPTEALPDVLQALADDDAIVLVPVPGA